MSWATGVTGRQRAPPESNRGGPPAMVGHRRPAVLSTADLGQWRRLTTMIIAVPTGVKVFQLAVYPLPRTVAHLRAPAVGAGVLRRRRHERRAAGASARGLRAAQQPVLVAHFHNMLIPSALFAYLARYMYWFPKAFGFTLSEKWGKRAFWAWLVGFYLAFMPL
jgi:cytochrome o ubiquinol oxidase subunit 1